jgi:hypothetical protein
MWPAKKRELCTTRATTRKSTTLNNMMSLRLNAVARAAVSNALSMIIRPSCASFSTARRVGGRAKTAASGRSKARSGPPPPAVVEDPWQPVVDKATGQTYWWNTVTDATTALGEPKPVAMTTEQQQQFALAQQQQQQQQPGLMGMVAQGMAFGVGSSMAHHAIGGLFGGGSNDSGGDEGGDEE